MTLSPFIALAATLVCNPSEFQIYTRPEGVPTDTLDEHGVPGAVTIDQAYRRIGGDATSAMIGLREGYVQRILFPCLVDAAGVAQFDGWGGSYTNVDFAITNHTRSSKSWISPKTALALGYDDDFSNPESRAFDSPRILDGVMGRCNALLQAFVSKSTALQANDNGYWLLPGIDHLSSCTFGATVYNENGSLIDFSGGAFFPLQRIIDDVSTPSNTVALPNETNPYVRDFYTSHNGLAPGDIFSYCTLYAVDDHPDEWLGMACTSTNEYQRYDLRFGPKLSEYLKAAAPGLAHLTSTNLHEIASRTASPRILWYRFALANALLGLTTDFLVCKAADNFPSNGDTREIDADAGLVRSRYACVGPCISVSSGSVATQEWSAVGLDANDSPVLIGYVQAKTSSVDRAFSAVIDFSKFKNCGSDATNLYFDCSAYTQSLNQTSFGWSDSENSFSLTLCITQQLAIATFNDSEDGDTSEGLGPIPAGTYSNNCFEVQISEDRSGETSGIDYGPSLFWTDDDAVPKPLRGTRLKKLTTFSSAGAQASVRATHSVAADGEVFFDSDWAPFRDAYGQARSGAYNLTSPGMFPNGSGLDKYIAATVLSLASASMTTNADEYSEGFFRSHGDETNATCLVASKLLRYDGLPTSANHTLASIIARGEAVKLLKELDLTGVKWGKSAEPDNVFSLFDTNAMTIVDSDLSGDAQNSVSNASISCVFPQKLNLMLVVTATKNSDDEDDETTTQRAKFELQDPDSPIGTISFGLTDTRDKPRRRSPKLSFDVSNALYLKFKFPMFDCSAATWPSPTFQKEYEPHREVK